MSVPPSPTLTQPPPNAEDPVDASYTNSLATIEALTTIHIQSIQACHTATTAHAREQCHERLYWAHRRLTKAHVAALRDIEALLPDPTYFRIHLAVLISQFTLIPSVLTRDYPPLHLEAILQQL